MGGGEELTAGCYAPMLTSLLGGSGKSSGFSRHGHAVCALSSQCVPCAIAHTAVPSESETDCFSPSAFLHFLLRRPVVVRHQDHHLKQTVLFTERKKRDNFLYPRALHEWVTDVSSDCCKCISRCSVSKQNVSSFGVYNFIFQKTRQTCVSLTERKTITQ